MIPNVFSISITSSYAVLLLASAMVALPQPASAEDAYRVVDGKYLVTTWGVFKRRTTNKIKGPWPHKPALESLNNMSDAEFASIAGERTFFAMCGLHAYYDRNQRDYVLKNDPVTRQRRSDYLTWFKEEHGTLDKFPIVCGVGDLNLIAEANARLRANPIIAVPQWLKNKQGSDYLIAVYTGKFTQQSQLAREYLIEMTTGIGGAMAHLMGGLAQSSGSDRLAKQELTVLEEVLSHYMTQYSRYGKSCLADGWFERRFTRELPDDVTFDQFGIETDRVDGGTSTVIFTLNKEFAEVCDELCNTGGALVISAMTGDSMRRKSYALGDVFSGVIEMLKDDNCSRPEVKQFEKSLLAMYAREQKVPLKDRNTLQNVYNR